MSATGEGSLWVACPACGVHIDDLWGFELEDCRWESVWCPSCNALIEMRCEVTYEYEARKAESKPPCPHPDVADAGPDGGHCVKCGAWVGAT